jgi:hypothetical protein
MFFTLKSSVPTYPWFLARSVVSLWVKSRRLRAWRALSPATSAMVFLSLFEYLPWLCFFANATWLSRLPAFEAHEAALLADGEAPLHRARLVLVRRVCRARDPEVDPASGLGVLRGGLPVGRYPEGDVPRPGMLGEGRVADQPAWAPRPAKALPADLRESHLAPVLGDAAKLYRLAGQAEPECRRALLEGWRTGGVLGIPPVVVRSIELAEDLLAGL